LEKELCFPKSIKISKENENVPVFISHGLADSVVDYKMSETSFKRLDASKHQITKVIEKGLEHSVTDRIIREAGKFMRVVLKKI